MNDTPKFCVNCKWIIVDRPDLSNAKCGHDKAIAKDRCDAEYLVVGFPQKADHYYCTTMRQIGCGPNGKLWEPK